MKTHRKDDCYLFFIVYKRGKDRS